MYAIVRSCNKWGRLDAIADGAAEDVYSVDVDGNLRVLMVTEIPLKSCKMNAMETRGKWRIRNQRPRNLGDALLLLKRAGGGC